MWLGASRPVTRHASHLILHCPQYTAHRVNAGIYTHHGLPPLSTLFTTKKGTEKLLSFPQESLAGAFPEEFPDLVPPAHRCPLSTIMFHLAFYYALLNYDLTVGV